MKTRLISAAVLLPVLLILVVLGAVKMKGNPFFTQLRPGKDEKIFKLIKFHVFFLALFQNTRNLFYPSIYLFNRRIISRPSTSYN